MKSGIELIAEERQKQITKHGFTGEHHLNHPEWYDNLQLQWAAYSLLAHEYEEQVEAETPYGWDEEWFNDLMGRKRKERLIISAALLAAELDRLNSEPTVQECDARKDD